LIVFTSTTYEIILLFIRLLPIQLKTALFCVLKFAPNRIT